MSREKSRKIGRELLEKEVPWTNNIWLGLKEFGPPKWKAEADGVRYMSGLPEKQWAKFYYLGQILLKIRYQSISASKFFLMNHALKNPILMTTFPFLAKI